MKVPVFLSPAIRYSGLAGANDNYNCLVCLSSGWVKLQGGVEISFVQRACVVVWVVPSCGERTGSNGLKVKKLCRHTVLPPERATAETECSVYLQSEQVSAHRASECFHFKLKPRRNRDGGEVVVLKVWVLRFFSCCLL